MIRCNRILGKGQVTVRLSFSFCGSAGYRNLHSSVFPKDHQEPFLQQLKVFSDEVQQQAQLSTILRSFLKLYTTMPVAKLADYPDLTEQEFGIQLLVFKHKTKNLVWTGGISALDGEFQLALEVDFYIDKDVIHIANRPKLLKEPCTLIWCPAFSGSRWILEP
ncbi:hypothetical protein STEG23_015717 [Scotinomys teguina]